MASYHLNVKAVKRSAGRSATAAAAYRHAERIECHREGRVHDYRAKQGVEASLLVIPEHAPAWAENRQTLWNAAQAREARKDAVVAREWELALPHGLDVAGRNALVEGFARELVSRYGVAADVAIHAPPEGDQRNGHKYVPVTERGQQVHEVRAARSLLQELAQVRERLREAVQAQVQDLHERAERAHEAYTHAREEGRTGSGPGSRRSGPRHSGRGSDTTKDTSARTGSPTARRLAGSGTTRPGTSGRQAWPASGSACGAS